MLDVSRVSILVVGGGVVALRKVRALVEAGGRPEIVAPDVHPELLMIISEGNLAWHRRPSLPGDAAEFTLVFAATDARDVNRAAGDEGADHGALVDVADD